MSDRKEITETNMNSDMPDIIKNKYGIEVFENNMSSEQLLENGFQKVVSEEVKCLLPIIQYAPQIIEGKINNTAVKKAFENATKNSYLCSLDPSMHLANIKGSKDVFLGAGLDNVSNQVSGQARWTKNDAVLSVSNVPEIALNVFNGLSIVTGQYFMVEINEKLDNLQKGIDLLQQHFAAEKRSELKAAFNELDEIIKHLPFIKKDLERRNQERQNLRHIQRAARENIEFNRDQITNVLSKSSIKDKKNDVSKNIADVNNYLVQYRYAVYMLNVARIVEISLANILDLDELKMYREDIYNSTEDYKELYAQTTLWKDKYIDENDALNKIGWGQIIVTATVGGTAFVLETKAKTNSNVAANSMKVVNNFFNDKREKDKQKIVGDNRRYILSMEDTEVIDDSVNAIDLYIKRMSCKAELISLEDEYYIRYIETKH